MKLIGDLIHELLCQLFGIHPICVQIAGNVDKRFVDRVHMDIFSSKVVQVQRIDVRAVVHIQAHAWDRNLILDIAGNVRKPAAVMDAKCFHLWCYSKAQCVLSSGRIGHDQIRLERVQTSFGTFNGSIERLPVDAQVHSLILCFHSRSSSRKK